MSDARFETPRVGHISPIVTLETHRVGRSAHADGLLDFPVLDAAERGPVQRLADSLPRLNPVTVFIGLMLAGLAVIALISIGLGFFLTRVV